MRARHQTRFVRRRTIGVALIIIGAAAFTACLRSMLAFAQDLALKDGGACGTGRPFLIVHQCSGADNRLLLVGLPGMVIATAVYAAGTSMIGRPVASAGQLAFVAGFAAIGWQFVSLAGQSITYLIIGIVVFFGQAAGCLVPLLYTLVRDFRQGTQPEVIKGQIRQPIALHAVLPGLGLARMARSGSRAEEAVPLFDVPVAPADALPQQVRPSLRAILGIWLATTTCGAAIGVILGSPLVSLVRQ